MNLPSLPHLILGGIFGMSLYFISDGKFSKTHAFILFMNNLFGPDAGWVLGVGNYTHTLLGSVIFAVFLTLLYHYFTKFTIEMNGFKNIEIIELDDHKLTFLNTYFLVLAGCIMHNYLDGIINRGGSFPITPDISTIEGIVWSIEDFMNLSESGIITLSPAITLPIALSLYVSFIITFVYFIKKTTKKEALLVFIHVVAFCLIFYLFGKGFTTFHSDYGAIVYITLFWLTPIVLCTLSTRDIKFFKSEKEKKERNKKSKAELTSIYLFFLLVIGIMTIIEGILLIFFNNSIVNFLINTSFFNSSHSLAISSGLLAISICLLSMGTLELLSWLKARKITDHVHNLIVVSIWLFIFGAVAISISIFGLFINESVISFVYDEWGTEVSDIFSGGDLLSVAILAEVLILIAGILNIIIALGLIFKNRKGWRLAIYYYLGISWTVVGLSAACYLSKDDVKEAFR